MLKKIKKLGISILTVLMMLSNAVMDNSVKADIKQPNIEAKAGIAVDAKTGQILYAKNAKQLYPVASMSKLLTTYILLQKIHKGEIRWNTYVKPTQTEVKISNNMELTNVPLKLNHKYTIRQLYQAMLVGSANAATMVIGNSIAGSQDKFINQMRITAKKLGINDAKIYSANGLTSRYLGNEKYPNTNDNSENEFSVTDMAIIARKLITTYPEVLETTKLKKFDFNDNDKITRVNNTNELLGDDFGFAIDGLKTGTSDAAGYCLATTANKDNHRIITVIAGATSNNERFVQTKNLLNYIYDNYNYVTLKKGAKLNEKIQVRYGKTNHVGVTLGERVSLWLPKNSQQNILQTKSKIKEVFAPIVKGEKIGTAELAIKDSLGYLDGKKKLNVRISTESNIEEVNIFTKVWQILTQKL